MNKERIDRLVAEKKKKLPEGVSIITPSDGLSAETQTDWLVALLSRMYVEHGITKNEEALWLDIIEGKCRLWFAVWDGQLVASAALIKQADGAVEIGRAVSELNGVGGLLMLLAVADHLSRCRQPVVAEVRVSDQFMGIPSGEATQTVCFRHLELLPHALVPAFNHGEPNRQEMFLFSASEQLFSRSEPIFLPEDFRKFIGETAVEIANDMIPRETWVGESREREAVAGWTIVQREPFCVIVPDNDGNRSLASTLREAENEASFSLVPISTNPKNAPNIGNCLFFGFVPCGFDRQLGDDGHPVLLLGKLRQETRLAPIKVVSGIFLPRMEKAIKNINHQFRKGLK